MIRLLLLLIIFFLVIRVLFRIFSGPWKAFKKGVFAGGGNLEGGDPRAGPVVDEMRACAQCGTYTPSRNAYRKKTLYFCNKQCHEAFVKRERV